MRCWSAVPAITPPIAGTPTRSPFGMLDVAVDPLADGGEGGDDDDRREAGPGRLALAVAEPEDQERHDHAAARRPRTAR